MNTAIVMVSGIVFGGLLLMFALALLVIHFIKKKQANDKLHSLPAVGADSSEYADMLVEKYRNQRIEGEL